MSGKGNAMRRERLTYSIGYAGALVLTGVAFVLVRLRFLSLHWTLGIVFGLALLQILVHFRCFFHITLGRSSRADLQLLLFSSLIGSLMVAGTLVVLFNLRSRMM